MGWELCLNLSACGAVGDSAFGGTGAVPPMPVPRNVLREICERCEDLRGQLHRGRTFDFLGVSHAADGHTVQVPNLEEGVEVGCLGSS